MYPSLGTRLFANAKEIGMNKRARKFSSSRKWKFQQDNPDNVDADMNIYGLRAYDAATAFALAIEEAGTTNFGFQKANIVNVNGNGFREIGFRTPRGLVNTLDLTTNESTYRTSNYNPLTIIWPGDKIYIPMCVDRGASEGWIPINGRRLRIGVPVKGAFQ
uniref:Uncharacterized protein n=1 Tax=Populus alba TaxID=43335 RepID=A0A4U5PRY0_POPAL|nr:hypothetical protein D5086_0000186360 [Populus alba]